MRLIRELCVGAGLTAMLAVGASSALATQAIPLPDAAVLSQAGSGPVLAGDDVVWVAKDGLHSAVRSRAVSGGPVRTLLVLPDLPSNDNRAYAEYIVRYEGDRLNVSQDVLTCTDACYHASGPALLSHGGWSGPAAGPLTPNADYCTQLVGSDFVLTGYVDVPTSAEPKCPYSRDQTITGTGASAGVTRTYQGPVMVAGHYIATWTSAGAMQDYTSTIRVNDWRTGAVHVVVTSHFGSLFASLEALSRDGALIVTTEEQAARLRYFVDPAHPTLAEPLDIPSAAYGFKPVGDRVAWAGFTTTSPGSDDTEVGLTRIGGKALVVTRAPGPPLVNAGRGFDFDGNRLTWAETKCGVTSIVVWDALTPAPPLGWRCGRPTVTLTPRVFVRSTRVSGRALAVRLRCPSAATRPCSGHVTWTTGDPSRISTVDLPFSIPPGHARTMPANTGLRWTRLPRGRTRTVSVTVQPEGSQRPKPLQRTIRVTRRWR